MKSTKNILLFLALTIGQLSYAIDPYTSLAYKNQFVSSLDNNDPKITLEYSNTANSGNSYYKYANEVTTFQVTADSLTQESYITPEMQWAVASLNQANSFPISKITGVAQNIQPISAMLQTISRIIGDQKQHASIKEALHAMLEATEIALSVVKLRAGYGEQDYIGRDDLIADLNQQKNSIQLNINMLNGMNPNNSYYSWVFGSGSTNKSSQFNTNNVIPISLNATSEIINIPADRMGTILKHNDYKQKTSSTEAANLLFQQCFIAQQQFKSNNIVPVIIRIPFLATKYIYADFPKIYDKLSNRYPICNDILTTLQDKAARRSRLLQIRQAVQTALYIANKKSSVNVGNLFPQSVVSYLDGIVSELMRYDAYLNTLCKNPNYGATAEDMARTEEWSTMSKIAAGVIVVAGVAAAIHYNDPNTFQSGFNQVSQQASNAMNWWNTPSTKAPAPAAKAADVKPEQAAEKENVSIFKKLGNSIKDTFSSDKAVPATPAVRKSYAELDAEEDAREKQAEIDAATPKVPTTYLEKLFARNNKAIDDTTGLGEYMQEKQAGILQDDKDVETVKGGFQFYAAGGQTISKNLGLSYKQIAETADAEAKNKEALRKQLEQESNNAKALLKEQEKILNQEQKNELQLTKELMLAQAQLDVATAKKPTSFFGTDAPEVAQARAKVDELSTKKDAFYLAIQSQKDLASDAKKAAEEKATATQKAQTAELQAKKAKEDAVRLAKVAERVEKENISNKAKDKEATIKKLEEDLTKKEAELNQSNIAPSEWIQEKVQSIKNYQLPIAPTNKPAHELTGLEKLSSMKNSMSNIIDNVKNYTPTGKGLASFNQATESAHDVTRRSELFAQEQAAEQKAAYDASLTGKIYNFWNSPTAPKTAPVTSTTPVATAPAVDNNDLDSYYMDNFN